jgi:hypothetical protein
METMPDARMRTLLNECLPPHATQEPTFSSPEQTNPAQRIFSENAVLIDNTAALLEVGLDGTVIATPGAQANPADSAPGRGVAPTCPNSEPDQSFAV